MREVTTDGNAKRRPGRPVVVPLSLAEVAEILRWPEVSLKRLLQRCPGALPGAVQVDDGWIVPERAIRELLGAGKGPLPQMCSVEQVAEFVGRSPKSVYRWLTTRDPETGRPLLPARKILDTWRIAVKDVLLLPAAFPDWAPARPFSFFSEEGDHGV